MQQRVRQGLNHVDVLTAKVVTIGPAGVGKTTLIGAWMGLAPTNGAYHPTMGANFSCLDWPVRTALDRSTRVLLHLWDTAGQERFATILPCYIRHAHVVLLVFDATRVTLEDVVVWEDNLRFAEPGAKAVYVLNKSDAASPAQLSKALGIPRDWRVVSALQRVDTLEVLEEIAGWLAQSSEATASEPELEPSRANTCC